MVFGALGTALAMAKLSSSDRGPGATAMVILGLGVLAAVVIGLLYGALTGNVGRGLGQAGGIVLAIAAFLAIVAAYQSGARRKRTSR